MQSAVAGPQTPACNSYGIRTFYLLPVQQQKQHNRRRRAWPGDHSAARKTEFKRRCLCAARGCPCQARAWRVLVSSL